MITTTSCGARALVLGLLTAGALAAPLAAQSADSSGRGAVYNAPVLRSPTRVGFARTILDSAEIARAGAMTLSELLTARAPSVSVFRPSGAATLGGTIRMRGTASLVPAYPLLIVDGIRMDASEEDSIAAASRLDDVPLADVARVEILPGSAAAALYGAGAAAGVIIVTTRAAMAGPARWSVRGVAQSQSEAGRLPDVEEGFGVYTDSGTPATYCALIEVAGGLCVQRGLRHARLDTTRAFRTGTLFGTTVGMTGGLGPRVRSHAMVTGQHLAGAVRRDDLRRRGGSLDLGTTLYGIDLSTRASFLRDHSTGSSGAEILTEGALTSTDSVSQRSLSRWLDSLFARSAPQETGDNLALGATLGWHPLAWLSVSATAARNRIDQRWTIADSGHAFDGHYERTRTETRAHDEYRGVLDAERPIGATGRASYTLGFEKLGNRFGYRNDITIPGFTSWYGSHSRDYVEGWFGQGRFALGSDERLVLGVGGRYEADPLSGFGDWHFYPTTDASVRVAERAGATLRLRGAYGEAAERTSRTLPAFAPDRRPERTSTSELGLDLAHERGGISVTWYSAVVHDLYRDQQDPRAPSRVQNRGFDLDAHAVVIDRPALRWELRAITTTLHDRVTSGGREGIPFAAVSSRPYTWSDANGDGIISVPEVALGPSDTVVGSALPSFEGSLHSTLTIGRVVQLGALLDRRSGYYVTGILWAVQCEQLMCAALNDPTTSTATQARAIAAALVPRGFAEKGDFTRLRELWLRYDVPRRLTSNVGAGDVAVTLAGRNLLTWTHYLGSDPEGNSRLRTDIVRWDQATVPLPREVTLRIDIAR